jgi:hypothetical protein
MLPDVWVPGNPDLWLLSELAFALLSVFFIWRIAIMNEQTPRSILAILLFALGLGLNLWAAASILPSDSSG